MFVVDLSQAVGLTANARQDSLARGSAHTRSQAEETEASGELEAHRV